MRSFPPRCFLFSVQRYAVDTWVGNGDAGEGVHIDDYWAVIQKRINLGGVALAADGTFHQGDDIRVINQTGAELLQIVAHVIENGVVETIEHLNAMKGFVGQLIF